MITKSYVFKIILVLIIGLGAFLRLYNLSEAPPSLNWDEAAWGYNAYSISETWKDEYGKFLPVFTRSFDEYKSTLPMYLMIVPIKLFGLTDFAVRLPSVILGITSILLIYLITKQTFTKNEEGSLTAAFLFAIEPWAVHFSRVYHDGSEALFFLLLGFLLFLKSKKKNYLLSFSCLSLVISMFTYNANKIIIPLIIFGIVIINRDILKKYSKKFLTASIIILLSSFSIFCIYILNGQAFARLTSTNIFILWKDTISPKIYYFLWEIIGRYLSYFSPMNLFVREPLEPVTVVAGNSIFYSFEFVFWIIGLSNILVNYKKFKEIIFIILISPLPAIVTWNWFQPGRVMTLFAIYSILIACGVVTILKNKYWLIFIVGFLYAFYLFDSINIYLPVRDKGNYQFGFKETVAAVMKNYNKYDQIIIDSNQAQPYIFYLYYGKYDPAKYISNLDLNYIGTPRKHYDFDKFKFRQIDWEKDKNLPNTLFVSDDFPKDAKVLSEITDRSGNIINKLVESDI